MYQPGTHLPQSPFPARTVNRLLIANAAVFFLQTVSPAVTSTLALIPSQVLGAFKIWQPLTYMFVHGSFGHLFFNLFVLWVFGTPLELHWGPRAFLKFYLTCGLGAGLFAFFFAFHSATIGASGAIFGVMVAFAMAFPNRLIYIWFLFPVRAKVLIAILAFVQFWFLLSGSSGGVAYFAHVGGIITGWLYLKADWRPASWLRRSQWWWRNSALRRRRENARDSRREGRETQIDSILEKISRKGLDNLTDAERKILENYTRHGRGGEPH
jgi:membrane associated rhomboid family serine protease